MSVTITDPLDNDVFPDAGSNDWTAYVTIDCADAVDGLIYDYNTGNVYQSDSPVCTGGPDANGLYTWQVPFADNNAGISTNDSLLIFCYDGETGDGASVADTASTNGGAYSLAKGTPKAPGDAPPSIKINGAPVPDPKAKTLTGSVTLTPNCEGFVFLVLANVGAKRILVYLLKASKIAAQDFEFDGVDVSQWLHYGVIAAIKGHKGKPDVYPPPKKKKEPKEEEHKEEHKR